METKAYKLLISKIAEMQQIVLKFSEKMERQNREKEVKKEPDFVTVKEMAYLIKKDRKTVNNYCKEYPEIERRKEGRENLIHQKTFLEAFKKGRKTPFDREVFNRSKAA